MISILRSVPYFIAMTALVGCVSTGTSTPVNEDTRACAKNFAIEGSALSLSGTTYTNFMFIPGVSLKAAMEKASKQIALDGMTITTLDKEGGMIAASNKVVAGKGDTVPLVTIIEPQKGGVQVRLKFSTGFGQVSTEQTVKDGFCRIISAVEKK